MCMNVCICSVWKNAEWFLNLVADGITAWMPFLLQLQYVFEWNDLQVQ